MPIQKKSGFQHVLTYNLENIVQTCDTEKLTNDAMFYLQFFYTKITTTATKHGEVFDVEHRTKPERMQHRENIVPNMTKHHCFLTGSIQTSDESIPRS